jgi:SOS response regulatory protein OraA/RecX
MKLMKKEFPKEMIIDKLEVFDIEIHYWDGNKQNICNQIRTLQQRGKSRQMITSLLISRYPYFKDEITGLLAETIDTDNLQKEVQKYKNRYNIEDNQVYTLEFKKIQEKIIASLLRKGFSYSDIKNSLK